MTAAKIHIFSEKCLKDIEPQLSFLQKKDSQITDSVKLMVLLLTVSKVFLKISVCHLLSSFFSLDQVM